MRCKVTPGASRKPNFRRVKRCIFLWKCFYRAECQPFAGAKMGEKFCLGAWGKVTFTRSHGKRAKKGKTPNNMFNQRIFGEKVTWKRGSHSSKCDRIFVCNYLTFSTLIYVFKKSHWSHVTFPMNQKKKKNTIVYNILIINNLYSFLFFREVEILGNVTCDICDIWQWN